MRAFFVFAAVVSLSLPASLRVSHAVPPFSSMQRHLPAAFLADSTCTFTASRNSSLLCRCVSAPGGLPQSFLLRTYGAFCHARAPAAATRSVATANYPPAATAALERATATVTRPHTAASGLLILTSAAARLLGREGAAAADKAPAGGLPGRGTAAAAVRLPGVKTEAAPPPPTAERPAVAVGLPQQSQQAVVTGAHTTTGVPRRTEKERGELEIAVRECTAPAAEAGGDREEAPRGEAVGARVRGFGAAKAARPTAAAQVTRTAAAVPGQGRVTPLRAAAATAAARTAAPQKTARFSSSPYGLAGRQDRGEDKMGRETLKSMEAAERPLIGTHSGTFHADEVLATVMLLSLPEYKDAKLLRSRDPATLAACHIVVDVGAEYSVANLRFDHHQRSFTVTFYDDEKEPNAATAEAITAAAPHPPAAPAAAATAATAAAPGVAKTTSGGAREAAGQGAVDGEVETRNAIGKTERAEGRLEARQSDKTRDSADKETTGCALTGGESREKTAQPNAGGAAAAAEERGKRWKSEEKTGEGKTAVVEKSEGAAGAAAKPRPATKLSSAGLIYKHFGKRVLQHRYGICDENTLETVYQRLYRSFVEAIDAIDNGVSVVPGGGPVAYRDTTNLSSRIGSCNPPWNAEFLRKKYPDDPRYNPEKASLYPVEIQGGDPEGNAGFRRAMLLAAEALDAAARGILDVWLPGREIVAAAVRERYTVHPSGRMIKLKQWCPFEDHVFLLEKEMNVKPPPLYCLYPDRTDGKEVGWRIRAIGIEGHMLESRLPLSSRFCGLRGSELGSVVCRALEGDLANGNVKPGDFVHCHATGFIAGTTTLDAAVALGTLTIEEAALTDGPSS